ncbi:MAG: P-type DNA transfer ATPase VirB11, partial [Aquamicrobium sp.]|nr:P-type DNA transfer ATPase VirB11 [Aquamicrobium sp.]
MSDTAVLRHYLAPILPLLEPVEVTELVINKPGEVGIEDHRGWHWHSVAELDSDWLATLAVAAASFTRQDVNAETPICSTILPGGERCQIVIPSVTPTGAPSFTVRKPSRVNLAIDQLAQTGLFT